VRTGISSYCKNGIVRLAEDAFALPVVSVDQPTTAKNVSQAHQRSPCQYRMQNALKQRAAPEGRP